MIMLYGIKNCDTIKKARRWLDDHHVDYRYHDVRVDGISEEDIKQWIAKVDWETLLNKRGTTWRKLDADTQKTVNERNVAHLLAQHPAMIKRPVLIHNDNIEVGFSADSYQTLFS